MPGRGTTLNPRPVGARQHEKGFSMRTLGLLMLMTLVIAAIGAPLSAAGREIRSFRIGERGELRYAVVLPENFDADHEYPALLALPPGAQNEAMAEEGLRRYWEAEARARGWVVVSPIAPESAGRAGFNGEALNSIPLLLAEVAKQVKIEGGTFHLAGVSNGGKSAFAAALEHPALYASLMVLPGFPARDADRPRLDRLKPLPVRMLVGERDPTWRSETERALKLLTSVGVNAEARVLEGQDHVLDVPPAMLFDWLDTQRPAKNRPGARAGSGGAAPGAAPSSEPPNMFDRDAESKLIDTVLNDLHDAAAKADGPRYFALFADDAVFLGTDATERWTIAEFRAYAQKRFDTGKGWTYRSTERHIFFGPSGDAAWFDERVVSEKYGECRGTGALVKREGRWLITQYNLLVPVPNDLLPGVADMIREHHAKQRDAQGQPPK